MHSEQKQKQMKRNLIASFFEGETLALFELCCEDEEFVALLIENESKPIDEVVTILVNHANENLI